MVVFLPSLGKIFRRTVCPLTLISTRFPCPQHYRQRAENGQPLTLWARFAAIEYARLAMEEEMREQEQAQSNFEGSGGWSN